MITKDVPRVRRLTCLVTALGLAVAAAGAPVSPAAADPPPGQSLRPTYHLTAPSDWLSDPQRPIYVDGKYHLYYLYGDRQSAGGGWRHATTTDNVVFKDEGIAIDKEPDFPVWTGSLVVDTDNTAGFGAGTVVALATQPTDGDRFDQEQYLYYSTDGGYTFNEYGPPVINNPGNNDWFRDPKIVWDEANDEWVAVIGLAQKMQFFTSPDLKNWTYESEFAYTSPNIGGMECPDIFQIKASDGTWQWVLAASMQGDYSGLPNTLAYWTGEWNGSQFVPADSDPQWADWGMDWYAAVTWPDERSPDDTRLATGWMNNWRYANENKAIPSSVSDDISGQMSIVREMRLQARGGGRYTLLSTPVSDLSDHVTTETVVPTTTVTNEIIDLDYHGTAYEIETDVSWTQAQNLGISVGVSASGARHTDLGIWQNEEFYLNRGASEQTGQTPDIAFAPWLQSDSPFDPGARSVHLRIFVDKGSVEVFVGDGEDVHSSQVFFAPGDTGVRLYADNGSATFSNMVIKEFEDITVAADRAPYYEDFESVGYDTWSTTGNAFGSGPAVGTLPGQQPVTGYVGSRLVNSFNGGDASTGRLLSPAFTVDEPYLNFLVGGGNHPRPGRVFNDFEGSGWGGGWTADGSFSGQGPSASSLPGQYGAKVADTFVGGGDSATGNITSPTFTINRDRLNFRLAGGRNPWGEPNPTSVNLVVDGVVQHSATGRDDGTMREVSWDVHDLVGRPAYLQIVDQATTGWGHIMVDHIVFADRPGHDGSEPDQQTTVNLLVDGQVVRTATGESAEHLHWESWLVHDLEGATARIEVVDNNTGSWGHVNLDEVSFDDRPAG